MSRSFLFVVFALLCVAFSAQAERHDQRRISVSGEGRISVMPDMAQVQIGISREARTASDAMRTASEAAARVLETVESQGIEPRDVQTSNVSLSPKWLHSNSGTQPRIVGYIASNDLTVRIRDLERIGGFLDKVVSDGANQMNGITFGLADTSAAALDARTLAVEDAAAKARTLADAAGVALGPVMTITEAGGQRAPQAMMRGAMMEAAMDVPVAAGELTIVRSVNMTFSIE